MTYVFLILNLILASACAQPEVPKGIVRSPIPAQIRISVACSYSLMSAKSSAKTYSCQMKQPKLVGDSCVPQIDCINKKFFAGIQHGTVTAEHQVRREVAGKIQCLAGCKVAYPVKNRPSVQPKNGSRP